MTADAGARRAALWTLLAAKLLGGWGLGWDIRWHLFVGRDSFWIPPHVMTYSHAPALRDALPHGIDIPLGVGFALLAALLGGATGAAVASWITAATPAPAARPLVSVQSG